MKQLFVLTFFLSISIQNILRSQCHPDIDALLAFYSSTNGENWVKKDGWKEGFEGTNCDPCNWFGITCISGRVTDILIIGNNISGVIPEEFSDLDKLNKLTLTSNDIHGELPDSFFDLNISHFNCSQCNITGVISPNISKLNNLEFFLMNNNQFSGSLPEELGKLSKLRRLFLAGNQLEGEIPTELGNLTNISELIISSNSLTGNIPSSFGNLVNVENLNFAFNNLSGVLPEELSKLNFAKTIRFHANNLSGCFPNSYSNLCNVDVNFSSNPELPNGGDFNSFCVEDEGSCITTNLSNEILSPSILISQEGNQIVISNFNGSINSIYSLSGKRIHGYKVQNQGNGLIVTNFDNKFGLFIIVLRYQNRYYTKRFFKL